MVATKKAAIINKWLILGIFVAIVFAFFVRRGTETGNQEMVVKAAMARDIAVVIESLYAVPGDVEYIYPEDVSKYTIIVKDNKVEVSSSGLEFVRSKTSKYEYVGIGESIIDARVEDSSRIKILKVGSEIEVLPHDGIV
tara:strand:+ start:2162 stop:2578 length:417 start_codon:yes stop_codon:yes gene_type:complete